MKSIMEEAASIAKAIEKGWDRAGKPQEFTVKVFEEPQKNFFGLTSKPAKIALFFQESAVRQPASAQARSEKPHHQPSKRNSPQEQAPRQSYRAETAHTSTHARNERDNHPRQDKLSQPKPEDQNLKREHQSASPWNPDLVSSAHEWVKESLQALGQSGIECKVEVDRYALKLQFNKLITENPDREKVLFRSWAYLIMQALRQKYKRPLKGLKVILMSNA